MTTDALFEDELAQLEQRLDVLGISARGLTDFLMAVRDKLVADPEVRRAALAADDPTEVREQVLTDARVRDAFLDVIEAQRSAASRFLAHEELVRGMCREIYEDLNRGGDDE